MIDIWLLQCEKSADLHPELKVLSVFPHEQPPEWKPESSHLYKYLVTPHSVLLFLAHNYCIVYCLDMSPSLSAVVSYICGSNKYTQMYIYT